jgi:hypothetical protein
MDAPRVAKLEDAAATADVLVSEIRMARRSFPVLAATHGVRDASSSPVFRNIRHYHKAWRLMLGYLNSSAVVLDASTEERTKQTWRTYEQWVFLQLAAAFRRAGLQCSSQRDFVTALSRDRFTIDLQRGTRLVFVAPDDRRVVMRYEPWVFSRKVASDLGETVYQGSDSDVPWSPDMLLEFMRPIGDTRFGLEYAVVVDAKYVRQLRDTHREQCLKYMKIRSVETGEMIRWYGPPRDLRHRDTSLSWALWVLYLRPSCQIRSRMRSQLMPYRSLSTAPWHTWASNRVSLALVSNNTAVQGASGRGLRQVEAHDASWRPATIRMRIQRQSG